MTTIESAQRQIVQLIQIVDGDLNHRGVLMIDRAQSLLTAVKHAKLSMSLCEQATPASFLNVKWRQQAKALQQIQTRLTRIIRGTAIPMEDHERP